MGDYSFAIKIGLTDSEVTEIEADTKDPDVAAFARENRGYWTQINMPQALGGRDASVNERVQGVATSRFRSFGTSRKR